jgi:hypothetical protein
MHRAVRNTISLPAAPNAARSISPKSKGHFSGHLIVDGPGGDCGTAGAGAVMEVESHLEMEVALVLSVRPEVADLENQVLFKWWDEDGAKWKRHYFDFRVNLRDGSRTAIFVKHSRKLSCEEFCATSRQIASQVTSDFADRVVVMTERDIDPVEIHNAAFLDSLKERDAEADAAARRALRGVQGARSVGELVTEIGLAGRGFRAVGRLLRRREIALVKMERITSEALVSRIAA